MTMRLSNYIFFVLLLVTSFQSVGQDRDDSFIVHLDKPFYVTGEQVLYKLFLPEFYQDLDVAVEVKISKADDKQMISQYFHRTEGKSYLSGFYQIPLDLNSANYVLSFSVASSASDYGEVVSSISFPIVYDLEALENLGSLKVADFQGTENKLNISITPTQQKSGGAQSFDVVVEDAFGRPVTAELSVSVADRDLLFRNGQEIVPAAISSGSKILKPNDKISVYGKCVNANGEGVKIPILGAYSSQSESFNFTKTNTQGNFLLELSDFRGENTFQFVRHIDYESDVSYKLYSDISPNNSTVSIPGETISNYVESSRKLKKINQYFDTKAQLEDAPVVMPELKQETTSSRYNFKEYKTFKNLGNFFKELITPLEFKTDKEGKYTASMTNPGSQRNEDFYLKGSPLFVIDGLVTKDADFVARVPFNAVESVELFYEPGQLDRMYKVMGISGAVRVKTNLPEMELKPEEQDDIISLSGLRDNIGATSFGNSANKKSSLPDFRPQLYWNPELVTDRAGKTSFSFKSSDDRSNYIITIVAKSELSEVGYTTYSIPIE